MLKKMMLLAMAVGALVAFAAPAVASADVWTDDGVALEEEQTAVQAFEGELSFSIKTPFPSTFGCQVTVLIEAEGPSGGRVTSFSPTTETCAGNGVFTGCKLVGDSNNGPWNIDVTNTPATVSASSGNLTILNVYSSCAFGLTGSHLEFPSVTVTPTQSGGRITALAISGEATNGAIASGSVTPEEGPTLGLE
jgi:hypothetical protein